MKHRKIPSKGYVSIFLWVFFTFAYLAYHTEKLSIFEGMFDGFNLTKTRSAYILFGMFGLHVIETNYILYQLFVNFSNLYQKGQYLSVIVNWAFYGVLLGLPVTQQVLDLNNASKRMSGHKNH
jgi:hypothetical protein